MHANRFHPLSQIKVHPSCWDGLTENQERKLNDIRISFDFGL